MPLISSSFGTHILTENSNPRHNLLERANCDRESIEPVVMYPSTDTCCHEAIKKAHELEKAKRQKCLCGMTSQLVEFLSSLSRMCLLYLGFSRAGEWSGKSEPDDMSTAMGWSLYNCSHLRCACLESGPEPKWGFEDGKNRGMRFIENVGSIGATNAVSNQTGCVGQRWGGTTKKSCRPADGEQKTKKFGPIDNAGQVRHDSD